ncbi:MAG: hypothetical protein JNM76_02580 [Betaproteobacteria bacterium]|nr:hypothetical protein [Betaproteobacteria bacterium]
MTFKTLCALALCVAASMQVGAQEAPKSKADGTTGRSQQNAVDPKLAVPDKPAGTARGLAPDPALTGRFFAVQQGAKRIYRFEGEARNVGDMDTVPFGIKFSCTVTASKVPFNTCPQSLQPDATMLTTPVPALPPGRAAPVVFDFMYVDESPSQWVATYEVKLLARVDYNGAPVRQKTAANDNVDFAEVRKLRP